MGTHWIALQLNGNNVTYLDNFAFEHIPKQVKKLKDKKNNKTQICRVQANDSLMRE